MAERTITIAVVGAGSAGIRHLQALKRIESVRPVAIPQRHERCEDLKRAGYATATDLGEAIRTWNIDLCIVASETGRHVDDGLMAISSGLDVLLEKPMCANAGEARKLHQEAIGAGRKLFVGCQLRFSESLNEFRQLLANLGRLHAVRIECQSYLPDWRPARAYRDSYSARANEGGVLRDLIHEIDYACWLFGWPEGLTARVENFGRLGINADEVADLLWMVRDGCAISIRLDYLSKPARRQMRAFGEKGTLVWDGIRNVVVMELDGEPIQEITSRQTRDDMVLDQARAFVGASFGQAGGRLATGLDGIKALAVCDAARRATQSKREEAVEY